MRRFGRMKLGRWDGIVEKKSNSEFFHKMIPALIMIVAAFLVIVILAFCGVGLKNSAEDTVDISGIWISVIENTNNDDGSAGLNSVRSYSKYFTWSQNENNGYYATKRIQLQNVEAAGSTCAYVRAAIIPSWSVTDMEGNGNSGESLEGDALKEYGLSALGSQTELTFVDADSNEVTDWRDASAYQMGDVIFELAEGWAGGWIYNEKDGYFYYKAIVDPGMATSTLLLESVQISAETYDVMQEFEIELQIEVMADAVSTQSGALEEAWGEAAELGITVRSDGTLGVYAGS